MVVLLTTSYGCEESETYNFENELTYPVNLTVTFNEDIEGATLDWDEVEGATGYSVWYAYSETSNYTMLADVEGTEYVDTSIERETERFYKIKAHTSISESIYSLVVSASNDILRETSNAQRTMWIWDSSNGLDEDKRVDLIAFCLEKNIEVLYFYTGLNDYSTDDDLKLSTRNFISDAHDNNIDVHGLTGAPAWILPENQSKYTDAVTAIANYNNSVNENERFDGYQSDIEPNTYFSANNYTLEERILNMGYFIDVHKQGADIFDSLLVDGEDFEYGMAISAYYDLHTEDLMVEYDGKTQLTLNHIADISDYFAIMSYQDGAERIINISEVEVDLMESLGKKAWSGVETIDTEALGGDPGSINFAEEGNIYMEEQLAIVEEYYKYNLGYGGVAIHYYTTYSVLQD